ncbi:hypothetical protein JHK86_043000 [Glycine max]|nr:hypothetical protein JHK86_043000 [Glycine max]
MVNKYDKERNTWSELGRLPIRADSSNGWGLAFKACGEKLLVVNGQRGPEALAILRPQEIAEHHALLTLLGWPPPLFALTSLDSDARTANQVVNPLLIMQVDLKVQYSENLLALCNLQELQRQRKH